MHSFDFITLFVIHFLIRLMPHQFYVTFIVLLCVPLLTHTRVFWRFIITLHLPRLAEMQTNQRIYIFRSNKQTANCIFRVIAFFMLRAEFQWL